MYKKWQIIWKYTILDWFISNWNKKYKVICNDCWIEIEKWYNTLNSCSFCKARNRKIIDKIDYYELELTWWEYTKIDKDDYEIIKNHCWYKSLRWSVESRIKQKLVKLHRFILNNPENIVDHINWDALDNRKNNLRICTQWQNSINKNKVSWKIKYKWVHWSNYKKCYIWQIDINWKRKTKSFKNSIDAVKWYDEQSLLLHWCFWKTNKELGLY